MAAALSSTLGSGSGVFRGGTQLNNMLGELDVIGSHEKAPGERLASMMTPTLVSKAGQPELADRERRLRAACGCDRPGDVARPRGMHVNDAICAPRVHVEGTTLHLEGGWPDVDVAALPPTWDVNRWDALNLYFGGVQAVQRTAAGGLEAAGDPRRGGLGIVVE